MEGFRRPLQGKEGVWVAGVKTAGCAKAGEGGSGGGVMTGREGARGGGGRGQGGRPRRGRWRRRGRRRPQRRRRHRRRHPQRRRRAGAEEQGGEGGEERRGVNPSMAEAGGVSTRRAGDGGRPSVCTYIRRYRFGVGHGGGRRGRGRRSVGAARGIDAQGNQSTRCEKRGTGQAERVGSCGVVVGWPTHHAGVPAGGGGAR